MNTYNVFGRGGVPSTLSVLSANVPLLAASIDDGEAEPAQAPAAEMISTSRPQELDEDVSEVNQLRCRILLNSNNDLVTLRKILQHNDQEALDLLEKRVDQIDPSSFPWVVRYPHINLEVRWIPKHSKDNDIPRDVILSDIVLKVPFPTKSGPGVTAYVQLTDPKTSAKWWYRIRPDSTICAPTASRQGSDLMNRRNLQQRWDALTRLITQRKIKPSSV